jgi:hypothetical protein
LYFVVVMNYLSWSVCSEVRSRAAHCLLSALVSSSVRKLRAGAHSAVSSPTSWQG